MTLVIIVEKGLKNKRPVLASFTAIQPLKTQVELGAFVRVVVDFRQTWTQSITRQKLDV